MAQRKAPYPFVKWAGGKGRMLGHVTSKLPAEIGTYCEPLVGGGAVFFELARQGRFKRAVLGDTNPELVNAYEVIRDEVDALMKRLRSRTYRYERAAYERVRSRDPAKMEPVERAARFIYLNRTCFNGLYRVNRKGQFNVPFGKYADPVICDKENLVAVSAALKHVEIRCEGFQWVLGAGLGPGDAAYFDPPYVPVSETSSFTGYTEDGFGRPDHMRLAATFFDLAQQGVSVALSNSVAPFAKGLFSEGCEMQEVMGSRSVGGPAEYRKPAGEILVWAGPRSHLDDRVRVALP